MPSFTCQSDALRNADQLEWEVFKYKSSPIDDGFSDDRIAGAYDDYETGETLDEVIEEDSWAERDIINDTAVGDTRAEIERRVEILGPAYPFELSENSLSLKYNGEAQKICYLFCLAICNSINLKEGEFARLPRVFEHLCCFTSKSHLGENSESIRIGWPRDPGFSPNFKTFMTETVAPATGEWHWAPQAGKTDEDFKRVKDEGVDFLTWLRNPDDEVGQLFILGQCACGNNWPAKIEELNTDKLKGWFHPMTWIPPMRSFAIPFVATKADIPKVSQLGGMFYDRCRATLIVDKYSASFPQDVLDNMNQLTNFVAQNS